MPKDDMILIAYKILSYVYECNKKGKAPTFTDMFNVLEWPNIPLSYLKVILNELSENNYIKGVFTETEKGEIIITVTSSAHITIGGVFFLKENSVTDEFVKIVGFLGATI